MLSSSTSIELLAPAKDLECGLAAINCGADAVYLGAARFGAREHAGNSLADIEALTRHAHKYWAKVYVTVNTLLRDAEVPQALQLIGQLYQLGIDGLIIQDVGLLECELPPLPLIASTQMHNHTPERVAFLEGVGFQRAILARELSMAEIGAIRRRAGRIELECFIHGSLCVCYSGQCYLSYAQGGRSGNRGQCAQPCRLPYSLLDATGAVLARNRHLLSLRDLNLTDHLRELIAAGVSSFKIEGRLKDKPYIMNVVAHYRARLDTLLADMPLRKSSSGASVSDFSPDVGKTFNRGYSRYYLHGRGEAVASPDTPKMVGEPVGTVIAVTPRAFTLDSEAPLHNGDGLSFFDDTGELCGTVVNAVQGRLVTPLKMEGITRGARIFRNHDHDFLTQLTKARAERQLGVTLTLRDAADGVTLSAVDEDGVTAEFHLPCEKPLAEKPEQALETIRKQLAKMGGSDFTCTGVESALSPPCFLPVSLLNALRREVLEALTAAREMARPRRIGGAVKNSLLYPERRLDYQGNVLNRQAENFYRRHGVMTITPAAESGVDLRGRKVMTSKFCLKYQFDLCPKTHPAARPAEPLTLLAADGTRLTLHFDCARCVMEVYYGRVKTGEST